MINSAQNLGCISSVMISSAQKVGCNSSVMTALDDQVCSEVGLQLVSWTCNGNQFLPKFQGQVLGDQCVEWAGVCDEALPAKQKRSISEQVYVKSFARKGGTIFSQQAYVMKLCLQRRAKRCVWISLVCLKCAKPIDKLWKSYYVFHVALILFPSTSLITIPVLVWFDMTLSFTLNQGKPLCASFYTSFLQVINGVDGLGFMPTGRVSSSSTPQIFQYTYHLWWLIRPPVYLLDHFPWSWQQHVLDCSSTEFVKSRLSQSGLPIPFLFVISFTYRQALGLSNLP